MPGLTRRRREASVTAAVADPATLAVAIVLWLLLGLFVLFPIAMLLFRVGQTDQGFDLAGVATILTEVHVDPNDIAFKRPTKTANR